MYICAMILHFILNNSIHPYYYYVVNSSILYILPVGTALSAVQVDSRQRSTAALVQRVSLSL